ncbi:hypothetical protein NPIL_310471 [Nephila pilipes]|uniref:Large ribosomal subunit protein bL33m n=1 Tax=Nephila pilipes TaxID=299642 RepID=A0A8X6TG97_NEPPI|nr:hypothetical protein NPIL_310471 [Nephila pilipes]
MAKAKSTHILVLMKSVISRHTFPAKRARQGDKLEVLKFDPYVQMNVLYREMKKIGNLKVKMGKYTHVVVTLKSILSQHKIKAIRLRYSNRLQVTKFDPHVQKHVLYKEEKKIVNFKP